jgi:hypothetical protein
MTAQLQNNLQQRILQQRTMLTNMLLDPMRRAANRCVTVWNDKSLLDAALMHTIRQIPYSTYLYAMNRMAGKLVPMPVMTDWWKRISDGTVPIVRICRSSPASGS